MDGTLLLYLVLHLFESLLELAVLVADFLDLDYQRLFLVLKLVLEVSLQLVLEQLYLVLVLDLDVIDLVVKVVLLHVYFFKLAIGQIEVFLNHGDLGFRLGRLNLALRLSSQNLLLELALSLLH